MAGLTDSDANDNEDVDIEALLKDVLVPLLEERDKQLKLHLDALVSERLRKTTSEAGEAPVDDSKLSPEVKALQARIKAMEQKAADDEAAKEAANLERTLSDIVQEFKTDEPKLAKLALSDALGEIVKASDGTYLTKDGRGLKDVAKEFFSTSTGQRLLPATMRNGTGVPKGQPQRSQGTPEPTLDDMLMGTFGSF